MLQSALNRIEGRPLRPFDIGYLIPILYLTVLGGRAVGGLTLLLAALASAYVLSDPFFSFHVLHARDRAELLMLLLVGATVVLVAGVFHAALRGLGEALATARADVRVREAAAEVEGVGRLRSCAVGRRGLDYQVALTISSCPSLPAPEAALLAGRVEAAVRRLDPFIAQVEVTVTP